VDKVLSLPEVKGYKLAFFNGHVHQDIFFWGGGGGGQEVIKKVEGGGGCTSDL